MIRLFLIGALAILVALANLPTAARADGPAPAGALKLDRRSLAPAPDYAMPRRGGTVSPARIATEGWQHCALSFDDGPNDITPRILQILNREGVIATYFPIAATAARHPEVIRAFVAGGHEIGNHSLVHHNLMKMSPAAQRADLAEANRILRGLGATPTLFRPPYAAYDGHLVDTARSLGLETVLWSLDVRDWEVRDAGMLAARVSAGAGPALVVLMHATYEWTEHALPQIIATLRSHGCHFVTLSQWLAFMHAAPSAPVVVPAPILVAATAPPSLSNEPPIEPSPAAPLPPLFSGPTPPPPIAPVEPIVAAITPGAPPEPVVVAAAAPVVLPQPIVTPAAAPPEPTAAPPPIAPPKPVAARSPKPPVAKPAVRAAVAPPRPVVLTLRPAKLAAGRGGKTEFRIEGDGVLLQIGTDADADALAAQLKAMLEQPQR